MRVILAVHWSTWRDLAVRYAENADEPRIARITQMEIEEAAVSAAGMQAARLPLQLDHFGASEAMIFSKRGSPRSGYRGSTLFRLVRAFSLAGGTRTGL